MFLRKDKRNEKTTKKT